MLRITRLTQGDTEILRLEGALRADWLTEVRTALAEVKADLLPLNLDLEHVTYADDAGIALLRDELVGGARIVSCSGFLAALLGMETL